MIFIEINIIAKYNLKIGYFLNIIGITEGIPKIIKGKLKMQMHLLSSQTSED